MSNRQPFVRTHDTNKPTIVGARWWQEGMVIGSDVSSRRTALGQFALISVALAGVGMVGVLSGGAVASAIGADEEARQEKRDALAVQRDYGWNFGSENESLTFDGVSTQTFDRASLASLDANLTPGVPAHRPHYVRTLFQSPMAMPQVALPGRTTPVRPLQEVLQPIATFAMLRAYSQGRGLASLFGQAPFDTALMIDLPGPESVAFAAGLATVFDPIFTFDNWPHPLGVVPAHLTLAAAAYYQPLFARQIRALNAKAPLAFVLDRSRLSAYTSESTQFDNRYLARVPGVDSLRSLGLKNLLYVTPSAADSQEMDDLNADLVACKNAGIDVKMVAASDFRPDQGTQAAPTGTPPEDWPLFYYGGQADTHEAFWKNYTWRAPRKPPKTTPQDVSTGYQYLPTPRATQFLGTGASKSRPAGMGMAPVFVSIATGLVVGAAVSRSGSFGRYSGFSGG
jgi:hypothetical protein